jgi:hypothetical protein
MSRHVTPSAGWLGRGNTCHNDMCNDMMAVKRHVRWHGTNELSRASHRVIWNLGSDMFLAL